MADELDYKIIERQLAILMTNSVAFSSKLYDMFVSSTPMDIEFNVWTAVDEYETITEGKNGEEVTIKLVPEHIIKFYKESELKPNFEDCHCIVTSNEEYEKCKIKEL